MRTTVEIPDEQRAKLLELAARRGEKGFSVLIQEALAHYLRDQNRDQAVTRALQLEGLFGGEEAAELEASTKRIRGRWR